MPSNVALTIAPVNLSATLAQGRYLCQYQGAPTAFYGAFPTSGPDPVDPSAMFYVTPGGFFVVNVGTDYDPVWVMGTDLGAGAGHLVIEAA